MWTQINKNKISCFCYYNSWKRTQNRRLKIGLTIGLGLIKQIKINSIELKINFHHIYFIFLSKLSLFEIWLFSMFKRRHVGVFIYSLIIYSKNRNKNRNPWNQELSFICHHCFYSTIFAIKRVNKHSLFFPQIE